MITLTFFDAVHFDVCVVRVTGAHEGKHDKKHPEEDCVEECERYQFSSTN